MPRKHEDKSLEELIELEKAREPLTDDEVREQVVSIVFAEIRSQGYSSITRGEVVKIVDAVRSA